MHGPFFHALDTWALSTRGGANEDAAQKASRSYEEDCEEVLQRGQSSPGIKLHISKTAKLLMQICDDTDLKALDASNCPASVGDVEITSAFELKFMESLLKKTKQLEEVLASLKDKLVPGKGQCMDANIAKAKTSSEANYAKNKQWEAVVAK